MLVLHLQICRCVFGGQTQAQFSGLTHVHWNIETSHLIF